MCVGAGLSGLGLIYDLIGSHWVAGSGAIPLNRGAPGLVDVASAGSSFGSTFGAFGSVLGIALWLWMASATSAGKSWPRTASTVFLVFGTWDIAVFLFALRSDWHLASGAHPQSTALLVAVLPVLAFWVLRLSVVVLLWRRESSDYFGAKAAGW